MTSDAAQEAPDLLAMPKDILERILSKLDRLEDIGMLSLASRASHVAVTGLEWTGIRKLRLSHRAPSPAEAAMITCKCPGLRELDATGCAQALPETLQAFAYVPLHALHLTGCLALIGPQGEAAVSQLLEHGTLRSLELCSGQCSRVSDVAVLKGVLKQPELTKLGVLGPRWGEAWVDGLDDIVSACPDMTDLRIENCNIMLTIHATRQPELKMLSLAGSNWFGRQGIPFLGSRLLALNVQKTNIRNGELREVFDTCPHLEHLNLSQCKELTDEYWGYPGSDAIFGGRVWDLDISSMGRYFTGNWMVALMRMWRNPVMIDHKTLPTWEGNAPDIRLNVSRNLNFGPEFLTFMQSMPERGLHFEEFRAEGCPQLAKTLPSTDGNHFNVLSTLTAAGTFNQLEVLDLRNTFGASQQSKAACEATLAGAIRSTDGCLKALLIDNGCAGNDVAEAIASGGAHLEQLSMPCCAGLSDAGLQAIAAACNHLQRLSVGGDSRSWSEAGGLAAFRNLHELEICERSLLTGGQLGQVLGQLSALEAFKLSSCPKVSDEALQLLPANSLKQLTLVRCDGIEGIPLRQLTRLETLKLSSCRAVNEQAIQVIVVSCLRLKTLELPGHILTSRISILARGHPRALQVSGGSSGQPRGLQVSWG